MDLNINLYYFSIEYKSDIDLIKKFLSNILLRDINL
jgi:hypothetical protein